MSFELRNSSCSFHTRQVPYLSDGMIPQSGRVTPQAQAHKTVMAPRLVRRRPLLERIKACLDPVEFLLWLSEELESSDWDQGQKEWATPVGILLNAFFLIARANSGYSTPRNGDDVFGDEVSYTTWPSLFVCIREMLGMITR